MKPGAILRILLLPGLICTGAAPALSGSVGAPGFGELHRLAPQTLVDHAARAPNPQSAAYLKLFMLDRIPPTKAVSGRSLVLLDKVPVAEYPDYDPLSDIGKVSIQWIQTSGPPAELLNPNTHRANVVLPNVSTPTPLTFRITVKNASGARTGELEVMVLPPR